MAVENDAVSANKKLIHDTMKDQYLTFVIENEDYGIGIAYVKEIIPMQNITRVPDMPHYIEGITNLRGELIGVLDVRKRFQKAMKEVQDESTCIIVIEYNEYTLGLVVDGVKEVMTFENDKVMPPPSAKLNHANQYISSIGKVGETVRLLLDLERFLAQD